MTQRRVVITGLGVVNALGIGIDAYWDNLTHAKIGIDRIQSFDPIGFDSQIAGEAEPFKISQFVPKAQRKSIKLMSRDIQLAIIAADTAVRDAGLNTRGTDPDKPIDIDPQRSGVSIGAGLMCCDIPELASAAINGAENGRFSLRKWGAEGMQTLTPLWLLKYLPNMLSCHITIIHDLRGPSNAITCAEASGLLSIGEACSIIRNGRADLMLAGGAENKVNPMNLLRQCLFHRASTHYNDTPQQACRPFDKDADGTVVGDGGAVIILEDFEHAKKRGARIYGEIIGFGASFDRSPDFITPDPTGRGITLAIKKAIEQSQIQPKDLDLLIPHGLAVKAHDSAEAAAIRAALGAKDTQRIPTITTKSRLGNCGAGAGAIDLATALLAMNHNFIPAAVNCPNPPKDYGLNIPRKNLQPGNMTHALCCGYTYGGQTASIVIRKDTV